MSQQESPFAAGSSGCHLSSDDAACQNALSGATMECCASLGYEVMSLFSFPEELQWDSVKIFQKESSVSTLRQLKVYFIQ